MLETLANIILITKLIINQVSLDDGDSDDNDDNGDDQEFVILLLIT